MTHREWEIVAPDGCVWVTYWFTDAAGFAADVWDPDEWNDVPHDPENVRACSCRLAGGIFDTLETLELGMGGPIPPDVRRELVAEAECNPPSEDDMAAWGRIVAFEVHRVGADGQLLGSFAPTWADDPDSPYWQDGSDPLVD